MRLVIACIFITLSAPAFAQHTPPPLNDGWPKVDAAQDAYGRCQNHLRFGPWYDTTKPGDRKPSGHRDWLGYMPGFENCAKVPIPQSDAPASIDSHNTVDKTLIESVIGK